jgi:hypothetical protein
MHFEIVGESTDIEIIANNTKIRILSVLGENSKGKQGFALLTEQCAEPKCTGLKRTALAREKCESDAFWIEDYTHSTQTQATICNLYSQR